MSDPNETYAYFTIVDEDLDPLEISRIVGVEPTTAWKKGDLDPVSSRERKFGRWSLYSRLPRSGNLEAHVADVLAQLEQNPAGFKKISTVYKGCMQLVGYFYSYYPGLFFTPEIVQSLGRFCLGVDYDFYYLYSNRREDSEA